MTIYRVRSTDGNNADSGATWALAKADLHTPTWAAGDTIWSSQAHAQGPTAGAVTIALNGTLASPTSLICVDDSADPATATATTASVSTSGTNSITLTGSGAIFGHLFAAGSGSSTANVNFATVDQNAQHYTSCAFTIANTSASSGIVCGSVNSGSESRVSWDNCTVKFGAVGQTIKPAQCKFFWRGGGLDGAGASPTNLISIQLDQADILVDGVDLSSGATTLNIFSSSALGAGTAKIRGSILPPSWTGDLGTPTGYNTRFELWYCSSGSTLYKMWISDYAGTVKIDTGVYANDGAVDGSEHVSWRMTTSANASYPLIRLVSPEIQRWYANAGTAVTVEVEIMHDGAAALKNDEIALELEFFDTSGKYKTAFADDFKSSPLAAGAAKGAGSSSGWTGASGTGPNGTSTWNSLKLSKTITPQVAGYIVARVVMTKPGPYTAFIDPKLRGWT